MQSHVRAEVETSDNEAGDADDSTSDFANLDKPTTRPLCHWLPRLSSVEADSSLIQDSFFRAASPENALVTRGARARFPLQLIAINRDLKL